MSRRGFTIIEMLVVATMMAIVLALSLSAVQRVRESSWKASSANNLKQISLSIHHFAASHGNGLPTVLGNENTGTYRGTLFAVILPYAELTSIYSSLATAPKHDVPLFQSPADPTIDAAERAGCSYAANAQLFRNSPNLVTSITDGASNTIALAEHYGLTSKCLFAYLVTDIVSTAHRATFADRSEYAFPNYLPYPGFDDVYPITLGGSALASVSGRTFQVAPAPQQADPTVAQTPHASGMLVAMADGSVRTIAGTVSETVYWSLVTPSGNEPVELP